MYHFIRKSVANFSWFLASSMYTDLLECVCRNVNKIWLIVSQDENLADRILNILLELIKTEPMFDEDTSSNKPKKLSSRRIAVS